MLWCGAAVGCQIAQHQPYCILSGEGWQKLRCERHAPEKVPADIDQQPQGQAAVAVPSFTRVAALGQGLRFDRKMAEAGEREE